MILMYIPILSLSLLFAASLIALTSIVITMIIKTKIPISINTFLSISGHVAHSYLPTRIYPSSHSVHRRPLYPKSSSQSPVTL